MDTGTADLSHSDRVCLSDNRGSVWKEVGKEKIIILSEEKVGCDLFLL